MNAQSRAFEVLVLLLFLQSSYADWAIKTVGGEIRALASDKLENIVVGVNVNGANVQLLTSDDRQLFSINRLTENSTQHTGIILVKLFPDGKVWWVLHLDGDGNDNIHDVSCDEQGNIFAVGTYTQPLKIYNRMNNTIDRVLAKDNYAKNGFIIKFSSDGTFQWASTVQVGPDTLTVRTINDSAIVAIKYWKVDDPNVACVITSAFGTTRTFTYDGLIITRFASNGSIFWANYVLDGGCGGGYGLPLSVNKQGLIAVANCCVRFVTCSVHGQFGTRALQTYGIYIGYLLLFGPDGSFKWSSTVSTPGVLPAISSTINEYGDIFWIGTHSSSALITDTTGNTNVTIPSGGFFMIKSNVSGHFQWYKWANAPPIAATKPLISSDNDNLFLSATFSTGSAVSIKSQNGVNELILPATNTHDSLLARYSNSGNLISSSLQSMAASREAGLALETSSHGRILYAGVSTSPQFVFTGLTNQTFTSRTASTSFLWQMEFTRGYRFIKFDSSKNYFCSAKVSNASIIFMTYNLTKPVFSFKDSRDLEVIVVDGKLIYVADGRERFRKQLSEAVDFSTALETDSIFSPSCGLFYSQPGFKNFQENVSNGTASFEIDDQRGYINEIALPIFENASYFVRFSPLDIEEFVFGFKNETHTYQFFVKPGGIAVSLTLILDGDYYAQELETAILPLDGHNIKLEVFALVFRQQQVSFFLNGYALAEMTFYNASTFLFTTIYEYGRVDSMAIMPLPTDWTNWLIVPRFSPSTNDPQTQTIYSDEVSALFISNTKISFSVPSEQPKPNDDSADVTFFFGLSSWLTYIILAGIGFLGAIIIGAIILLTLRRKRRQKETNTNTTINFTVQTNISAMTPIDSTLVNTDRGAMGSF